MKHVASVALLVAALCIDKAELVRFTSELARDIDDAYETAIKENTDPVTALLIRAAVHRRLVELTDQERRKALGLEP